MLQIETQCQERKSVGYNSSHMNFIPLLSPSSFHSFFTLASLTLSISQAQLELGFVLCPYKTNPLKSLPFCSVLVDGEILAGYRSQEVQNGVAGGIYMGLIQL